MTCAACDNSEEKQCEYHREVDIFVDKFSGIGRVDPVVVTAWIAALSDLKKRSGISRVAPDGMTQWINSSIASAKVQPVSVAGPCRQPFGGSHDPMGEMLRNRSRGQALTHAIVQAAEQIREQVRTEAQNQGVPDGGQQ